MHASLERLRKRREEEGDEGFTLIELLIVIVILGILAAIVVFAVQNLTSSSSQASCGSDYKTVETAIEAYKAQMGGYPNSTATPTAIKTDSGTLAPTVAGGPLLTGSDVGGNVDSSGAATTNVPSPSGSPVGPWLKDVPANGTHYTISVSNDGVGTITVTPTGTPGNPCSAAS